MTRQPAATPLVYLRLGKDWERKMGSLPWLETWSSRNKKGQLGNPEARIFPLSHHIGCLYAHLFMWQLSMDMRYKDTVFFESDAVDPSLLALPLGAVPAVVKNAPEEYDLIFLTTRVADGGKRESVFEDSAGNKVELWNLKEENGEAGLSSYIVSDRFHKKMFKYMIKHGADMVDAWLSTKLCVSKAFDNHGNFVDWGKGTHRYLNCYHAKVDGFRSVVPPDFPALGNLHSALGHMQDSDTRHYVE